MAWRRPRPASAPIARTQEPWLIACALLTLAPHAQYAPLWLSIVTAIALAWRAAIWWLRRALPPRWLLTALVVGGTLAVFATYRQLFGKDPGVALLIIFLALKLLELRSVRDALAAVFLCYFLLLTHFLNAQEIENAATTVAALLVITAALASLSRAGRGIGGNLRLAALMLAQAVPFMLILFLLFPRVEGPLWGLPIDAYSGLTGLSDTMSPGSISGLSVSGAIAFRARFDDPTPPRNTLYWRGPVLRFFDGRTWRSGPQPLLDELPYETDGAAVAYSITLEPHNKPWLFALELPSTLPTDSRLSGDYQLLARRPVRNRIRYEMRSVPGLMAGKLLAAQAIKSNLLLPPEVNPRARELAAGWRRQLDDDEAIIREMLQYLRRQPFVYTLSPPPLGANSVDDFLFETRRGFCEHYASAFVFMMRAAGVPARVVTGYQGGESNPVDGYLIVRQSDAHAWTEVWLKGRGWLRIDPTAAIAPGRIESGLAAAVAADEAIPFAARSDLSFLRDLRFRWEAMNNSWNQWVLGYNPERQREVLSRLGMRQPDWQRMTAAMATLGGLVMLLLTAWALHQRTRIDPLLSAWNRLGRKLARAGLARHGWEGPRDYARRVAHARPALGAQVEHIAQLYIALRYGRGADAGGLAELKRLIARLDLASART